MKIIAAVKWEPRWSSNHLALELELSQPSVLKVRHNNQLHPYHYLWSTHLFLDNHPLCMQFCEWLQHQHAADELFLHNILWTDKACFTPDSVFNTLNSHLWAQDNPHTICKHGYWVHFSVSVWAGITRNIVMGTCLLTDRLSAQWYHDFHEIVLLGMLEDVPLALRQRLWFQHDGAALRYGEDVWQWLNMTYSGSWIGCGGQIAWHPLSLDLTGWFFHVGSLEGAHLYSPSQDDQRSFGKTWSRCDNGQCQHVKACSKECCAARCHLPWNGQRPLPTSIVAEAPIVWSLDSLYHMMVTCILKTKHYRTLHNNFWLLFRESHYGELVHEFCFILCIF
jgi:hypothetical protein